MERITHNHGPDEGIGTACREHRTGDCIIQELIDRATAAEKAVARVLELAREAQREPIHMQWIHPQTLLGTLED